MLNPTDDVIPEDQLFRSVFGMDDDEEEAMGEMRESGRVRVCSGEWRREPDGRWRLFADDFAKFTPLPECDHLWQPHDVYGFNCIECAVWSANPETHDG